MDLEFRFVSHNVQKDFGLRNMYLTLCNTEIWILFLGFNNNQSAHFKQNIHACTSYGHIRNHWQPWQQFSTWQLWWEQSTSIQVNKLTYQKEYNTNSYICKDNAHPDFIGQWVQKREDSWFGFLWLFDHDGDAQRHEGFGEIYHLFSNKSDRQGSNCYICFL